MGQPFGGDYVKLRRNPLWREALKKSGLGKADKSVVFADVVNKVNRSNAKVSSLCFLL